MVVWVAVLWIQVRVTVLEETLGSRTWTRAGRGAVRHEARQLTAVPSGRPVQIQSGYEGFADVHFFGPLDLLI